MSKIIYLILFILQHILFTNGQYVQTMPPQDVCVPSSTTLHCPNNYVAVVRNAFYGVALIVGSCSYSLGDCIADTMSQITCTTDSVECTIYATRKKLPQCNDQSANYFHIEYDCVLMSMDDSAKEYNVCQNGTEITTDYGILKSPGYPSQFQTTTTECFCAIHVPSDKAIRLWLSDLYISPTDVNCQKDHIYIIDSVDTYQHCGIKRYAYPYLCSSAIIIQYSVTTNNAMYRGMRMYFEIVDRSPNDNCPNPNGAITPIQSTTTTNPDITTTIPIYATLGIASPVVSFQLCKRK
jgi:hypothetical protein